MLSVKTQVSVRIKILLEGKELNTKIGGELLFKPL